MQTARRRVVLASGSPLPYDLLIVTTGTKTAPKRTEGLLGPDRRRRAFDFYTLEGAVALRKALQEWKGCRLVVSICEMPIKRTVAPLEFAYLVDWWLCERRLRDRTELVHVTPLSETFTKPMCSKVLGHLLEEERVCVVTDFSISRVDDDEHAIVSWDGKQVTYDLPVTVPVNMGDAVIERSGLGDELNFVSTDPRTLQSKEHPEIFVIGDAADVPTCRRPMPDRSRISGPRS